MSEETAPILVPVDFSAPTAGVLSLAGTLAACARRPLVVLHMVHDSAESAFDHARPTHSRGPVDRHAAAKGRLAPLLEQGSQVDSLRDARTILVEGLPAARVLEVGEREGADMIVMGSHGRSGTRRLLMGSVAEHMIRHARIPVTVYK